MFVCVVYGHKQKNRTRQCLLALGANSLGLGPLTVSRLPNRNRNRKPEPEPAPEPGPFNVPNRVPPVIDTAADPSCIATWVPKGSNGKTTTAFCLAHTFANRSGISSFDRTAVLLDSVFPFALTV